MTLHHTRKTRKTIKRASIVNKIIKAIQQKKKNESLENKVRVHPTSKFIIKDSDCYPKIIVFRQNKDNSDKLDIKVYAKTNGYCIYKGRINLKKN
jgi:hypothetical protein